MKLRMLSLFGVFLLMIAAVSPAQARRYFSREVRTECNNLTRNVAIGAGLGALLGYVIGDGRTRTTVIGGLLGAGVGAGVSCERVERYHRTIDSLLNSVQDSGWRRYDGCGFRVLDSGYSRSGKFCRAYEVRCSRDDRETHYACRERDRDRRGEYAWKHGYDSDVIYSTYSYEGGGCYPSHIERPLGERCGRDGNRGGDNGFREPRREDDGEDQEYTEPRERRDDDRPRRALR